jgi:two-component system nitrate/nitrite response regulator NarL
MGTLHRGAFPETITGRAITLSETTPITVVLVDDQVVFRNIARAMLERDGDCNIVGEAADGYQAMHVVESCDPDVVVMDIQMSVLGGLEATRRILDTRPDTNIVLVSMGSDIEYPRLAREIGARGFLPKRNLNPESLRALLGISPTDALAVIAA